MDDNQQGLLLTTARILRATIRDMQPTANGIADIEDLNDALRPYDPSGAPPVNLVAPQPASNFYPQDGAVYRHYKGGLYRVLMVVRREGSAENMVVYQPQDGTKPWVRPLTEFGEKFSYVSNVGWDPA